MAPVNLNMQDAGYLLLHWYDSNNDACITGKGDAEGRNATLIHFHIPKHK